MRPTECSKCHSTDLKDLGDYSDEFSGPMRGYECNSCGYSWQTDDWPAPPDRMTDGRFGLYGPDGEVIT